MKAKAEGKGFWQACQRFGARLEGIETALTVPLRFRELAVLSVFRGGWIPSPRWRFFHRLNLGFEGAAAMTERGLF